MLLDDIFEHYREQSFKFPALDQGVLDSFFGNRLHYHASLPWEWNYKTYWGLPTSGDPYIIHSHGPKPDGALGCIVSMDPNSTMCATGIHIHYESLVRLGFESDDGLLANLTLKQYHHYVSHYDWNKV